MSLILINSTDFIGLYPQDYRHFYGCLNNFFTQPVACSIVLTAILWLRILRNCIFFVLLTVHLSIILVIDQHNARILVL